jgi:hypothetical protein
MPSIVVPDLLPLGRFKTDARKSSAGSRTSPDSERISASGGFVSQIPLKRHRIKKTVPNIQERN